MVTSPTPEIALSVQSMGAMAPQQIAALAQQQQLQNLTQQLQSQLSLQNMNLSFFNQVICDSGAFHALCYGLKPCMAVLPCCPCPTI